jgi:hypothetical protein
MCHYYLNFVCYGIASVLESNERVWRVWGQDAIGLVFVDGIATALVGYSLLRTMDSSKIECVGPLFAGMVLLPWSCLQRVLTEGELWRALGVC